MNEFSKAKHLTDDLIVFIINKLVTPNGGKVNDYYWKHGGINLIKYIFRMDNVPFDSSSINTDNCKYIATYITKHIDILKVDECKYKQNEVKNNLVKLVKNPNMSKLWINKIRNKYTF